MRNWLIFAGVSCKDYGVYTNGKKTFNGAEREYDSVKIPGRSGELTIDHGTYKNIPVEYESFIVRNFRQNTQDYRNFLLTKKGYQRLEDTYNPGEYRMARYAGSFDVDVSDALREGNFVLSFDCMPQRFLRSGDQAITLTASSSVHNANLTVSKPIIRVYGVGTVTIGGIPIQITANQSYTDINCETESAYRGSTNLNGNIVLNSTKDFWELKPGNNTVTIGTGITRVEITPKWWIL